MRIGSRFSAFRRDRDAGNLMHWRNVAIGSFWRLRGGAFFDRWWRSDGGGIETADSFNFSSMVISIEKEAYVDRRCVD
jgi:hypothetical protein